MQSGKLYRAGEEQFLTDIDYQLLGDTLTTGELLPAKYCKISDGGDYIVELEDNQRLRAVDGEISRWLPFQEPL